MQRGLKFYFLFNIDGFVETSLQIYLIWYDFLLILLNYPMTTKELQN